MVYPAREGLTRLTTRDADGVARAHDAAAGEPAFRARQVWRWTAAGAHGYEQMTDVPAALRERLAAEVPFSTLELTAWSPDDSAEAFARRYAELEARR